MSTPRDRPKPGPLGEAFGLQFSDPSVVAVYHLRPPSPPAMFDILLELLAGGPSNVLDAGRGTGDIARPLARLVERVDAVDIGPMLTRGRRFLAAMRQASVGAWSGGSARVGRVRALVTCGESWHWMDWKCRSAALRRALVPGGYVAILLADTSGARPWADAAWQVVAAGTRP